MRRDARTKTKRVHKKGGEKTKKQSLRISQIMKVDCQYIGVKKKREKQNECHSERDAVSKHEVSPSNKCIIFIIIVIIII
jgi:hypothetical protein